jgi:hypothetical protein
MTETLPPEIIMDDAEIDEAVAFINEKVAAHVLRGSLEVGEYVLAKFFNNDIHLAGSRNRYKPVSYRKLCDHPDLSVSRFTLMKMVKTAAQQGFLVAGGIAVEQLHYSQLAALTRLDNNEEKLALARECSDEGISVEELKMRVREICNASASPSPVAAVENYLVRINRWIRKLDVPEGLTNQSVITGADPADREKILDVAGGILEDISVITNRIQRLVTSLTESPQGPETETENPDASENV